MSITGILNKYLIWCSLKAGGEQWITEYNNEVHFQSHTAQSVRDML